MEMIVPHILVSRRLIVLPGGDAVTSVDRLLGQSDSPREGMDLPADFVG